MKRALWIGFWMSPLDSTPQSRQNPKLQKILDCGFPRPAWIEQRVEIIRFSESHSTSNTFSLLASRVTECNRAYFTPPVTT